MARKSFVLMVMGTILFFFCSASSAEVPQMINYQGKLTTATGGCFNGTVSMTFTIYSDDQGTIVDWTETQAEVVVQEGVFSVLLGSVNPIPDVVFDGSIKYLGVQVGADPEMTPLKPMVSVPYAYRAGTAAGGGGWVDDGTVVRLETSTDYVGIGTTTPAEKLDVSGNIKASGTITSGNTITIDGANDKITASSGTIDFDNENLVTTGKATIGPGHTNTGTDAFVAGYGNTASGSRSTVGGGYQNTASGTYYSTVGGGQGNTASGSRSTVSGGRDNAASDQYCTVGGVYSDTASSYAATVGGGEENTANGNYSTVGGGNGNTASGWKGVVGGGGNNIASKW